MGYTRIRVHWARICTSWGLERKKQGVAQFSPMWAEATSSRTHLELCTVCPRKELDPSCMNQKPLALFAVAFDYRDVFVKYPRN